MPELPDLEIFKTNIWNRLTSKRLVGLEAYKINKVNVPQAIILEALKGRELLGISRVGKELFFDFGDKLIIAAHLMLNGRISIVDAASVASIKSKIFSMSFERETIVFSDAGGLCTIKFMPVVGKAPDAFDGAFSLAYFLKKAHKSPNVNIKAFLIDQKVVKGIGNAYADEILYAARVSPHCLVGRIPDDVLETLYNAIGVVLHGAIESIRRISPDIISGEERSFLKVHTKLRKETESGCPIKIEQVASKITYYTDEQKLY